MSDLTNAEDKSRCGDGQASRGWLYHKSEKQKKEKTLPVMADEDEIEVEDDVGNETYEGQWTNVCPTRRKLRTKANAAIGNFFASFFVLIRLGVF